MLGQGIYSLGRLPFLGFQVTNSLFWIKETRIAISSYLMKKLTPINLNKAVQLASLKLALPCHMDPMSLRVIQNAYFSLLTLTKELLLVTFCDST